MTREEWVRTVLEPALARSPAREPAFQTASGYGIEPVYGPEDIASPGYARDIADPETFPRTRWHSPGWQPSTMSPTAGSGTPDEGNARFRELIATGATGLTVRFDTPTHAGRDPDDPRAVDAVGRGGVSVSSSDDMWVLFEGVDLRSVSVTLAANDVAPVVFALFLVAAERRGVAWSDLGGALHHDIYGRVGVRTGIGFPHASSIRLANDVFAFCHRHVPGWCVVTVGSRARGEEPGTPQRELSEVIAEGIACIEHVTAAGADVDAVAPLVSFRLRPHADLFEDVARRRAGRQVWARLLRERFGAQTDGAATMRVQSDVAADGTAAADSLEDAVRTTYHALAAVLGGTSALHAAPGRDAGKTTGDAQVRAIRAQQVLASETGLGDIVDPLAGSWWLERLTADIFERTMADVARIERADEAPERERQPGRSDGVRREERAGAAVRVKGYRDSRGPEIDAALAALARAAEGGGNCMDALVVSARSGATLGEMCDVLRSAWGEVMESDAT